MVYLQYGSPSPSVRFDSLVFRLVTINNNNNNKL
jgi:hypothetical protein